MVLRQLGRKVTSEPGTRNSLARETSKCEARLLRAQSRSANLVMKTGDLCPLTFYTAAPAISADIETHAKGFFCVGLLYLPCLFFAGCRIPFLGERPPGARCSRQPHLGMQGPNLSSSGLSPALPRHSAGCNFESLKAKRPQGLLQGLAKHLSRDKFLLALPIFSVSSRHRAFAPAAPCACLSHPFRTELTPPGPRRPVPIALPEALSLITWDPDLQCGLRS